MPSKQELDKWESFKRVARVLIDLYEVELGVSHGDLRGRSVRLEAGLRGFLKKNFRGMPDGYRTEVQEYAVNNHAYWRIDPSKYS
jgi:hypothetical protein